MLFVLLAGRLDDVAWGASAFGGRFAGMGAIAALGAAFGVLSRRAGRSAPWGAAGLLAAGIGAAGAALALLPRLGAAGTALLGLGAVLAGGWISRFAEPESERAEDRLAGASAGFAAGAGLTLFSLGAAPALSASLPVPLLAAAGWCLGAGLAAAGSGRIGRQVPPGLLAGPALVAIVLWAGAAPDTLELVAEHAPALSSRAGLAIAAAAGLALGLGGGRVGPATLPAASVGAAAGLGLPTVVGDGSTALLASVVLLGLALPGILAVERRPLRAAALLLPLGAVLLAVRPPEPDPRRTLAPHEALRDPVALAGRLEQAPPPAELRRALGGSLLFEGEGAGSRLWARGRTRLLDDRERRPDLYFGHLPGLLVGVPDRSAVLYAGLGAPVDALRRAGAVDIEAYEPSTALRRLAVRLRDWNRSLAVDPAVRFVRTAPRTGPFDLVLVDLPPPFVAGAGTAWSARSFARVARSLAPGGAAAFRVPLRSTSVDELALLAERVTGAFPEVSAWLDPGGADHLVLVARPEPARPDAAAMLRRAERGSVAEDLRRAGLSDPIDVLERALVDRPGLAVLGSAAPRRDGAALSMIAGLRTATGGRTLPLSALSGAASELEALFDLSGLAGEEREAVTDRLRDAGRVRGRYLEMLAAMAQGEAGRAMAVAERLGNESLDASGDLRALTEPWVRRGDGLMARGLSEQALAEYLIAWSFAKQDRDLNLKLGAAYRRLGRFDAAARHFEQVLSTAPSDLDATLGLADARRSQGRLSDALGLLEEAEKAYPGAFVLLVNLAHVQTELAVGSPENVRERLATARRLFLRASAIEPLRPEPRAGLASVYYRQDEYDRALDEINRAMTLEDSCNYRYWRGIVQLQRGALDEAAADLQESLLACPDNLQARNALGVVQVEQGRFGQGRATWEEVLRRDPDNAEAKTHLERFVAAGYDKLDRADTGR